MRCLRVGTCLVLCAVGAVAAGCGSEPASAPSPRIDEVVPSVAAVGNPIEVRGAGFGESQGEAWVAIAGAFAPVRAWRDDRIEVEVPEVGPGEVLVVVNRSGARSSPARITVTP